MMLSNSLECEVGARTETGYIRDENQDCMTRSEIPRGQLYVIADGMGGHKGGARAAQLTTENLVIHLRDSTPEIRNDQAIQIAFDKTNKIVYEEAHSGNPETQSMGSTAVLLLITGSTAKIAHVGDSRAYLYRNGILSQLTRDHTQVQRMVDANMLSAEQARVHPDSNVLDRAIGNRATVDVEISPDIALQNSDGILLCSDGLCGYIRDKDIESTLSSSKGTQDAVHSLVELALNVGGEDNVTVQFIQYGKRQAVPLGSLPKRTRDNLTPLYIIFFLLVALLVVIFEYCEFSYNEPIPKDHPSAKEKKLTEPLKPKNKTDQRERLNPKNNTPNH